MLGCCGPGKLPEKWKFPKVVRRGCKRSFGPRDQEASCAGAKWGCTGAKEGLGGARDSWETFAPWAQKSQKGPFAPSPNHFWRLSLFGQFPRSTASQKKWLKATLGVGPKALVWLPLRSLAVKKKTFFCCKFWAVKNQLKSAGEIFSSGLRGAKTFSVAFRIVFRIFFFLRFSNRFSYRFKSFSGAVSFCQTCRTTKVTNKWLKSD